MKSKYTLILISIPMLLAVEPLFASARFPSTSTLPASSIVPGDVTCKCDANKDPCCHPPVGESSKEVDISQEKTTDVSKCQCDPKTDPCCKKIEGTKDKK